MPAKYTCAICKQEFKSLLIPREKAVAEIGTAFQKHFAEKHPKDLAEISQITGKIVAAASALAFHNMYIELDENDTEGQQELSKLTDSVMEMLGFENGEEGEEGLEELPEEIKNDQLLVTKKLTLVKPS